MNKYVIGLTLSVAILTFWLCFSLETKNEALANSDPVPESSDSDQNEFFVTQIRYASKHYKEFGRVDEQRMHWAPTLCAAAITVDLKSAQARISESDDPKSHGGKLYFMFANHRSSYVDLKRQQPFGQILVKESWTSVAMEDDFQLDVRKHKMQDELSSEQENQELKLDDTISGGFIPYAQKDGRWFKADKKKDLFVMIKLAPGTEGSDHGWIYGTVNTKGDVTSSGKIQSCIHCHESSKKDRMFGLPVAKKKDNRKPE